MNEQTKRPTSSKNIHYFQRLEKQLSTIEQEARMVLPGIQAIFGFQLIAVFNSAFDSKLTELEKKAHLTAIFAMSVSALLILAPAAYHRATCRRISEHFISFANACIGWAMAPLGFGLCIDLYIVSRLITGAQSFSIIFTGGMATAYISLWFIYPSARARYVSRLPVYALPSNETSE